MSDKTEHSPKRLPPVRLPFEKKSTDFGTWSYDHRAGICITLIAYFVFGIVFISARIDLGTRSQFRNIIIELPPEQRNELTPEERQMMARMQQEDFSDVRNAVSNENAENELNSDLRDDRGTQASQLYQDAARTEETMRANRAAYEAGLAQEQETARRGDISENDVSSQNQRRDSKINGRVTVNYSFVDPDRTRVNLVTPAYMCAGGGSVELSVTLDNNGYVTATSVNKEKSWGDECMQDAATSAARQSRFNVDPSAPSRHRGTITYAFIPQ